MQANHRSCLSPDIRSNSHLFSFLYSIRPLILYGCVNHRRILLRVLARAMTWRAYPSTHSKMRPMISFIFAFLSYGPLFYPKYRHPCPSWLYAPPLPACTTYSPYGNKTFIPSPTVPNFGSILYYILWKGNELSRRETLNEGKCPHWYFKIRSSSVSFIYPSGGSR